jgi:hypothetical protein
MFRVKWAGQQPARPVRSRTASWLKASSRRQLSRQKDSQSKFHLTNLSLYSLYRNRSIDDFQPLFFCQAQLNLFSLVTYRKSPNFDHLFSFVCQFLFKKYQALFLSVHGRTYLYFTIYLTKNFIIEFKHLLCQKNLAGEVW